MIRTILAVALALLACTSPSAAHGQHPADAPAVDWSRVPEYRIVPGDLLSINLGPRGEDTGDVVRNMLVRPDGRVSVFPIGDVIAAGRTVRELELAIVELLSAELKQPRVTVDVLRLAGNQVHVLGRVKKPGSYEAGAFMTVLRAITEAGGFEDDANRNSVIVFHREGAQTVEVARIRLDEAIKRGTLDADRPLSRFDIVYVPRNSVGNLEVFGRSFFGWPVQVLQATLVGWELFRPDRVVVARATTSQ